MKNSFHLSIIIVLCMLASACGKKGKKQYSTWIVNGQDTFRTNDVTAEINCNPDHTFCTADLHSNNLQNRFGISFYLDHFPVSGSWLLGDSIASQQSDPDYAYMGIYYNNSFYRPKTPNNDTLYVFQVNNQKAHYQLKATWFVRYNNNNDSLLIQGDFYEP